LAACGYICPSLMKVITIQDGSFFRITLVPESAADSFMITAIRKAEGSKARVIPVETHQIEKVINPYRELRNSVDESKEAVILEVEVTNFPRMVEAEPTEDDKKERKKEENIPSNRKT